MGVLCPWLQGIQYNACPPLHATGPERKPNKSKQFAVAHFLISDSELCGSYRLLVDTAYVACPLLLINPNKATCLFTTISIEIYKPFRGHTPPEQTSQALLGKMNRGLMNHGHPCHGAIIAVHTIQGGVVCPLASINISSSFDAGAGEANGGIAVVVVWGTIKCVPPFLCDWSRAKAK